MNDHVEPIHGHSITNSPPKNAKESLDVDVELSDPNFPTGPMKRGTIRTSAHLHKLGWRTEDTSGVKYLVRNSQHANNELDKLLELC